MSSEFKPNKQQGDILDNPNGYRLVLAGAGAGKTTVLTQNVSKLIIDNLAKPYEIMAVTFTNKASKEMKERLMQVTNGVGSKVWIGTFHGICIRLLARYGKAVNIEPTFSIADEKDQLAIVKKIAEEDTTLKSLKPEEVLQAISRFKNNLLLPSDVETDNDIPKSIAKAYSSYQDKLRAMNCLDFDDIIMATVFMLRQVKEVRDNVQNQFKYIFIDEAQDTNKSQYELALLLSGKYKNLTMIGDVDQGIYSWRGANISLIQEFMNMPNATVFPLTINYRCAGNIIKASNDIISKNINRPEKELIANKPSGDKIAIYKADTEYYEAEYIAGIIDYLCHRTYSNDYKDFYILYRNNNQARVIEEKLARRRIPAQVVNGISFFQRAEIKDTLAYLRLICNPYDIMALNRIANAPKRGVGQATLDKISEYLIDNKLDIVTGLKELNIPRMSKKAKSAMLDLSNLIEKYTNIKNSTEEINISKLIKDIMNDSGYINECRAKNEDERAHNVYDLADMAEHSQEFDEEEITLESFIRDLCLLGDSDNIDDNNTVKMMTVHSSKGLENEIVFLTGMEENIFPSYRSVSDKDSVEEERRLFYVAITRAKANLYITYCSSRSQFGETKSNAVSRFVDELPDDTVVDITKLM